MTRHTGFLTRNIDKFRSRFRPDPIRTSISRLHGVVVERARSPILFAQGGVPDTLEGRFDMVTLFASMAMIRLRREGETARRLSQGLFDAMFAEFDDGLRALGVGDTSVPKRIKKMASAFYGRLGAYDEALNASDDQAFEEAVGRNVFASSDEDGARLVAREARAFLDTLRGIDVNDLIDGRIETDRGVRAA